MKRRVVRLICGFGIAPAFLSGLGGVCWSPPGGPTLSPGDHGRSIRHDARVRLYTLRVPRSYDGRTALPLVIMLHGGFGGSENAERDYGWAEKADSEGFLAAFPEGTGLVHTWNAEHCCGYAREHDVDDVGFVAAMIDDISSVAAVDPKRIYATGMSNGAMLTYRLGAERSDLFAAIGPVAGAIGGQEHADSPVVEIPVPAQPVPTIIFHGTVDQHVLYDGGPTQAGFGDRVDLSVADAVAFWVAANQSATTPMETVSPSGNIIRQEYAAAGSNANVVLYRIVGQGHAWPGGRVLHYPGADAPSTEISATDTIWEFFSAHPRP